MAVVPIIKIPNKILLQKTENVTEINEEVRADIQNLLDTLDHAHEPEGAGLAATQIGLNKRICVVRNFVYNPADENEPTVQEFILINPKIISRSRETITDWEGCLSVPDVYGKVERYKKIKVKAMNEMGENIRLTATGFFGAVVQHEIDHLDGILFTEKVLGETYTEEQLNKLYENS
jgi:peptide deformylase